MDYASIIFEKREHIAKITLNRPDYRNALSLELIGDVVSALRDCNEDSDTHVVIIAGAGNSFCAGAKLDKVAAVSSIIDAREYFGKVCSVYKAVLNAGKTTIASVQGYALAGGCGLATCCDLVIAADNARFGYPETNLAIPPSMVMVPLYQLVGPRHANELVLTGRQIDAHEAERIGLVNRVVPVDQLEAATWELAREIAAKSPVVLQIIREVARQVPFMEAMKGLEYAREMTAIAATTEDAKEGIASFFEKRKPVWKGR